MTGESWPPTDGGDADRADPAADPDPDDGERPGPDWVGVLAVAAGFVGIVFFGILLALVAGILGAIAGQRAREAGRSLELAYLAFILGAVDGVVWLALHLIFEVPIQVG